MLYCRLQIHHSICQSIFLPGSHSETTVWLWWGASRRPCSPACSGLSEGQPGSLTPMPSPRPMLLWAAKIKQPTQFHFLPSNLTIVLYVQLIFSVVMMRSLKDFETYFLWAFKLTNNRGSWSFWPLNIKHKCGDRHECESSFSDGGVSIAEPLTLAMEQV